MRTRALLFVSLVAIILVCTPGVAWAQGSLLIEPTGPVTVQKGGQASFEFVVWNGEGGSYDCWIVLEKPNGREITRFSAGSISVDATPFYHSVDWTANLHPGWYRWRLYVEGYGATGGERLRITGPALR